MITVREEIGLSNIERSQLERLEMAKGCWREGRLDDAQIVVECVRAERLSPRIFLRTWVTQATFRSDSEDFIGALSALDLASEHLDSGTTYEKGTFFSERGRATKGLGKIDLALTDYAGAAAAFEEVGHEEYLATVEKNTAGLYLKIGDFENAYKHVDRSVAIYTLLKSDVLCQAYDTQAQIFLAEGKLEAAFGSIQKAIALCPDNDAWKGDFAEQKSRIEEKALAVLGVETVKDLERVKVGMVRRALSRSNGSVTRAGKLLGLDHRGVDRVVAKHKTELCRGKRHERKYQKAIIQK